MEGMLYRYPHPHDSTRFIYVGQGFTRDTDHRSSKSSFGRRFRNRFPDVKLPQPIKERVTVINQSDLNEEETIWMFHYHTWRGYDGGMNLQLPGSSDYKRLGRLAVESGQVKRMVTPESRAKGGRIQGRRAFESGQLASITTTETCSKGGLVQGKRNAESGHMARISVLARTPEHQAYASRIGNCLQWCIRRGKPCRCGKHLGETQ
jgi:hypothetical protein